VQIVSLEGHAGEILPLQVSISADPVAGAEPLTVQFQSRVTRGQPPYSYRWDFDDLKSNTDASPVHIFTGPGVYMVSLKLMDINNQTVTSTVDVAVTEAGKPGILEGQIWDETGVNPIIKSNTVLYPQSYITDTTLVILDQRNSYMFASLMAGKYTVLAIPDPAVYPAELPTYLGDNIMMYYALWVQVDGYVPGKDIKLIKKPPDSSGSGNISGNIVSGAGKGLTVTQKSGAVKGDPLSKVYVFLQGATDSKLKAYDISSADGSFSFGNLENGSYYFLADYEGKPMDATNTPLVLNDARKNIEILATVGSDKITVKDLATGINNTVLNRLKVYPVPAKDNITILIPEGLFRGNSVRMKILDLSGKYVYINNNYDLSGNPVTLNIDFLSDGIYLLELADNERCYRLKIVKMN